MLLLLSEIVQLQSIVVSQTYTSLCVFFPNLVFDFAVLVAPCLSLNCHKLRKHECRNVPQGSSGSLLLSQIRYPRSRELRCLAQDQITYYWQSLDLNDFQVSDLINTFLLFRDKHKDLVIFFNDRNECECFDSSKFLKFSKNGCGCELTLSLTREVAFHSRLPLPMSAFGVWCSDKS